MSDPNIIIGGYSKPRFIIKDILGNTIDTIDLPLTNEGGLIDRTEIKSIEHDLLNYSTEQRIDGYLAHFILYYEQRVIGATALKVKSIVEYSQAKNILYLVPRIDKDWRVFPVILITKDLDLALLKGGAKAIGHRFVVLEFKGTQLLPSIPWYSNDYIMNFSHPCCESIKFII